MFFELFSKAAICIAALILTAKLIELLVRNIAKRTGD